jgi:hypothetical protein
MTPNEGAPERVWLTQEGAPTWEPGRWYLVTPGWPAADGDTEYVAASVVEGLVEALRTIQDHEGKDADGGYVDEWSEAAAFAECQRLARAALSRYEATRQRGGTEHGDR